MCTWMSGLYQTAAIGTKTPPNRVTISFQAIYNISFKGINLIETLLMFPLEILYWDKLSLVTFLCTIRSTWKWIRKLLDQMRNTCNKSTYLFLTYFYSEIHQKLMFILSKNYLTKIFMTSVCYSCQWIEKYNMMQTSSSRIPRRCEWRETCRHFPPSCWFHWRKWVF